MQNYLIFNFTLSFCILRFTFYIKTNRKKRILFIII
jgi:hypothetical protein